MHKSTDIFLALLPFVDRPIPKETRNLLKDKYGLSSSSLYRKLERVKNKMCASVLESAKRGPKHGSTRKSDVCEKIISEVIHSAYLTKNKPRVSKVYLKLVERFDRAGIEDVPSISTFRRRIARLEKSTLHRGRLYASERNSKYSPKTAHLSSTAPMALVQIDHTKLDVIIISSIDGMPLGRVIFTVVTDIYTRLVLGFHIGLYGPNTESVKHALAHACFDKSDFLKGHGIEGRFETLGIPTKLMMDNAPEFKSTAMAYGCGEYGISQQYGLVATPHYRGHVESLIGTLNDNLRNIPGATYSNIEERGDYPSEKLACFTLPMIEKYVTNFIVNYYHNRPHSKLGISPMQKYELAIQNGFTPRLPPKSKTEFLADFSKTKMRTVRDIGIEFDCIEYWNPYVASLHNQNVKDVRVIPIPQTIQKIDIIGPDGNIHSVKAKNLELPDMTRREWDRYREIIRKRNKSLKMTNNEIAHYIRIEDEIERSAKRQSKRLRRANDYRALKSSPHHKDENLSVPPDKAANVNFDPSAAFKTIKYGGQNG